MQKQVVNIPFGQGLDTKSDPWQAEAGSLLNLENAVFNKQGMLEKRAGFASITNVTNASQLSTLSGSLVALGSTIQSYSTEANAWVSKGTLQPVSLSSISVVKDSYNQDACDSALATNGLICSVYHDARGVSYTITNSSNGVVYISDTLVSATATQPRVTIVAGYFVITYTDTTPALKYISISISAPTQTYGPGTISTQVSSASAAYDCAECGGSLAIAWNGNDGGGAVRYALLPRASIAAGSSLGSSAAEAGLTAVKLAVAVDTLCNVWIFAYGAVNVYAFVVSSGLASILPATQITASESVGNLTVVVQNAVATIYYELSNTYSFNSVQTKLIRYRTLNLAGGISPFAVLARSVGLASKAFILSDNQYVLSCFGEQSQPTYFLLDASGNAVAKLAPSNAANYYTAATLPSVTVDSGTAHVAYLVRDFLTSVNKNVGATVSAAVYTEAGVNIAAFDMLAPPAVYSAELSKNLILSGGKAGAFDGASYSELGFNLYPEEVAVTTATAGGLITAQTYYYAFCYEWTDAVGNLNRSAPSIPVAITTTGATSTNTINVSTLRLTQKSAVRVVGYRWSTGQQSFYQFTSITSPTLNSTTIDSVQFVDTLADSAILGNTLLYTTGGVVENIAPPALHHLATFKNRLFGISAEDRNVIYFTKPVVQQTPVEFSDLFSIYAAPTVSSQGFESGCTALVAMDDKLIIFKYNSIYYVTGDGPDLTGNNGAFSDPTFISSAVGCIEPSSIVTIPTGIMFQSNKGIWLLGRDLSTKYIGADVESSNNTVINSSVQPPATNEARFVADSGQWLVYNYYYDQWGYFTGNAAISSTMYEGLHTLLMPNGEVRQQQPGLYLDGTRPTLITFTTAWIKLAGLQGFQRAQQAFLLSNYLTPHKLNVSIAYDFLPSAQQNLIISPTNYVGPFGSEALFGSVSPFGGPSSVEQWRLFLTKQKCQSLQLTISEVFDASYNTAAGAGLSFSGLSFLIGVKGGLNKVSSTESTS